MRNVRILLLLLLAFTPSVALADVEKNNSIPSFSVPIEIDRNFFSGTHLVVSEFRYLPLVFDSTYTLTLEDVSADNGGFSVPFTLNGLESNSSKSAIINRKGVTWTYFSIRNTDSVQLPLAFFVAGFQWDTTQIFYRSSHDTSWQKSINGAVVPYDERAFPTYPWRHNITLHPNSTYYFYVRTVLKHYSRFIAPLVIFTRYVPPPTPGEQSITMAKQQKLGALLAIILVMCIYNFAIFLFNREASYLWYSLTLFFLLLNRAEMHLSFYSWALSGTFLLSFHEIIARSVLALLFLSCSIFVSKYLQLKEINPKIHLVVIRATVVLALLNLVIAIDTRYPFVPPEVFNYWVSLPEIAFAFLIVSIIFLLSSRRDRSAIFLSVSMLFPGVGFLIEMSVTRFGLFAINSPWASDALDLGVMMQIVILSLGLADRMRRLRLQVERQKAEQEERRRLEEEERRRFLEEQKIELERQVSERTLDLQEANEEISRQMDILAEQSRDIELANTSLQEKNIEIDKALSTAEEERHKADLLLLNVLPASIAERLKAGERNIADRHEDVSILFADIVGFTPLSAKMPPDALVALLNELFSRFDRLTVEFGVERIKTIGDAYMVAAGVPLPCDDHAHRLLQFAFAMLAQAKEQAQKAGVDITLRIGINSGAVIGAVVGEHKFTYDIWSDAVNTAARMESHGAPHSIHCTADYLKTLGINDIPTIEAAVAEEENFSIVCRGPIDIKGKGTMTTYFIVPK